MAGSAQQLMNHETPLFQTADKLQEEIKESRKDILSGPVMTGAPLDIANLARKLVNVMKDCGQVEKRGKNDFHNYNYFMAEDVMAALNRSCTDHGVACIPQFQKVDEVEKTQRSGQVARIITVAANVYLIDTETGASIMIRALGTGEDVADKALPKAQTMAIKYALMCMVLISPGNDPEADRKIDEANSGPAKQANCPKCGTGSFLKKTTSFEGQPVAVYDCPTCRNEFRKQIGQ